VGELDHAGIAGMALARRLSCDASVMRVAMAGKREPLEVGRRTPVVPASIRRAVVVRDRCCRFPGCDRPAPWCDAHHIRHWAEGGETSLGNLVLLCRPHHRMVHEPGGFSLEMREGKPVVRRSDDTVLEDRAPP
jgi:5-methylcytosine-specific restriction protein A